MGAAFMLYAQGLLPFLLPLSIVLFEPNLKSRRRMLPFLVIGRGLIDAVYIVGANGVFAAGVCRGEQHRLHKSSHE